MTIKPTTGNLASGLFTFGPFVAIGLILWVLIGSSKQSLTPRQVQLEATVVKLLEQSGSDLKGRSCKSSSKSFIYYSCDVSDLQPVILARQLEADGWVQLQAQDTEIYRYSKPAMLATIDPDRSDTRWRLYVYHSSR